MKWYKKAILQKILSFLPMNSCINMAFQRFFGRINDIDARSMISEVKKVFVTPIVEKFNRYDGLKITEIGTGWNPFLPITMYLLGNECTSFDKKRHLNKSRYCFVLNKVMQGIGEFSDLPYFSLNKIKDSYDKVKDNNMGCKYIAPIDTTNLPLEDDSQDVVLSRLVLQHIPKKFLPDVVKEHYRILKKGGIAIHRINLHDEYAQDDPRVTLVNFLKFPSWFWDNFINNDIKFVNQDRYPYYTRLFEKVGFNIKSIHKKIDDNLCNAISNMKVANEFRKYSIEELSTIGVTVVLEKC